MAMTREEKIARLAQLEKMYAEIPEDQPDDSAGQTALDLGRGVAKGATAGFADELTGLAGAAVDPQNLGAMTEESGALAGGVRAEAAAQDPRQIVNDMREMGFSDEDIRDQLADVEKFKEAEAPDLYDVYRDRARRLDVEAEERSPIATAAGEIGGAITSGALAGAAKLPALAAEGALHGFGTAEGTAEDQALQTLMGAGTAAGLGAAGKGVGKLVEKGKKALGSAATKQAVKSLEPTTAQKSRIFDQERMGKQLLDEDIVGALRSPEKMLKKSDALVEKLGNKLDTAYDDVGGAGIPKQKIVDDLIDAAAKLDAEGVANKPAVNKILSFAEDFEKKGGSSVLPKALRSEHQALDDTINYASEATSKNANKIMRNIFRLNEEDAFKAAGVDDGLVSLKRQFGDAADAKKILKRTASRDGSGSIAETIKRAGILGGLGAGAMTDNPWLQAAAVAAAGGRKIGRGGLAKGLYGASKARGASIPAGTIGRGVLSQNPYEQ